VSRAVKGGVVAVILLGALALRIAEVDNTSYRPRNDAGSYLTLASSIAHTGDYSLSHAAGRGAGGTRGPTAYFAPAFPYYLALVDIIDGHETRRDGAIQPARVAQAVLGTITVALTGLVAFELFGGTAGLIALVLAAVYPVLIELTDTIVAENLLTVFVLGAVYAGLRVRRAARTRTRLGWVAGAGLLTGLATLTHENGVLLLIPLIPAVWTGRPRLAIRSLAAPVLLLATTALMILPWTIRNAVVMHHFIPVSDETGITLVGTYNPKSAADPKVSYKWRIYYGIPGEHPLIRASRYMTEPQLGAKLEHQALHYISDHSFSPLVVAFHNTLRLFELEGTYAWQQSATAISLSNNTAQVAVYTFWALCLLALAGAFTRLARSSPKWVWMVPLLLALSVVLVNVETPRFRAPVDPFLILLAAAGLATASGWVARRLGRAPVVGKARGAVAAGPG
jgi:4-amino-4-deoxy-L-arabinose transferase-like glycosyltransferase